MLKSQAQISSKKIVTQALSLTPDAVVSLFEIDFTDICRDTGAINAGDLVSNPDAGFFRFHNCIKLTSSSILWNDKEYIAAPINAEGYEMNARGTLPRPTLTITVSDQGIPLLTQLKEKIYQVVLT